MKKYLKFIIIFTVILGLAALLLFKRNSATPNTENRVTDKPPNNQNNQDEIFEENLPPEIIAVSPGDKELNVPLDAVITITFDRSFRPNEIAFSMAPQTESKLEVTDNILTVTPLYLRQGMKYTYIIKYAVRANPSRTYSFTTEGPLQELPDTRDEEAVRRENEFQLANHPDVYLANQTPYSSPSFEVTAEFDNILQNPRFIFTVTLKQPAGKADFNAWAMSSGLTQEQLALLDIEFR